MDTVTIEDLLAGQFASAEEVASEQATYLAQFDKECPDCGVPCDKILRKHDTSNYAEYRCPSCGMQRGWIPWPKNRGKRRDLKEARRLIAGHTRCQICRRPVDRLPANERRLEPHHLIAVSEGGTNDPRNLIAVCPGCHRWIELRIREYASEVEP